ncbi:MAG: hypothetical protein HOP10_16750 [Chitinophagaceae bacterium]|nr:hypothetical protein [Chitinophagaceae bacterium]
MKSFLFVLLISLFYSLAQAQPSDATIKKDAIGNESGVLSFKFTKSTGTRQWNRSTGNWEYVRGVAVKRKSEYPGINLVVYEDVVYQYTGGGGYSFWKVRVVSNEYEGLPNPTLSDITGLINKDPEKFYGYYYSLITKLWHQPQLADTPGFIWSSPKAVEFRMKMKFDYIVRSKGIETLESIWNVHLYRDEPKGPWKSMFATRSEDGTENQVLDFKAYTPQQLADFEKQTLQFTIAEQKGKQQAADLAKTITVPEFNNADEMLRFLHDVLRNGNPDKLRAVMLQVLAPGFFVEGSKVQLMPTEERNLADVITAVYNNKVKYKDLYCAVPTYKVERWGNSDTRKDITIRSVVDNCNTLFTVDRVNIGYVEGVPVTRLVILSYGIYVRQDQDAINYINSFSDRSKICPND